MFQINSSLPSTILTGTNSVTDIKPVWSVLFNDFFFKKSSIFLTLYSVSTKNDYLEKKLLWQYYSYNDQHLKRKMFWSLIKLQYIL